MEFAKLELSGTRYSLDQLSQRFANDILARTNHRALQDAQLTAEAYLELLRLPISGKPQDRA